MVMYHYITNTVCILCGCRYPLIQHLTYYRWCPTTKLKMEMALSFLVIKCAQRYVGTYNGVHLLLTRLSTLGSSVHNKPMSVVRYSPLHRVLLLR